MNNETDEALLNEAMRDPSYVEGQIPGSVLVPFLGGNVRFQAENDPVQRRNYLLLIEGSEKRGAMGAMRIAPNCSFFQDQLSWQNAVRSNCHGWRLDTCDEQELVSFPTVTLSGLHLSADQIAAVVAAFTNRRTYVVTDGSVSVCDSLMDDCILIEVFEALLWASFRCNGEK